VMAAPTIASNGTLAFAVLRGRGGTTATVHAGGAPVVEVQVASILYGPDIPATTENLPLASCVGFGLWRVSAYLRIGGEIVRTAAVCNSSGTAMVPVARGRAGTSAVDLRDGELSIVEPSTFLAGGGVSLSATWLVVESAAAAGIRIGNYLEVDDELVRVIASAGNNLTVARAQAGTAPAAHFAGAGVIVVRSATIRQGRSGDSPGWLSFEDNLLRVATGTGSIAGMRAGSFVRVAGGEVVLLVTAADGCISACNGTTCNSSACNGTGDAWIIARGMAGTLTMTVPDGSSVSVLSGFGVLSTTASATDNWLLLANLSELTDAAAADSALV
jgi:hypothetical protein